MASFSVPCPKVSPLLAAASSQSPQRRQCVASFPRPDSRSTHALSTTAQIQAADGTDLKMTLAIHLSLWHPDDVKLQWDIMQRKNESSVHLPSLIIGVGVAIGFGALVAISAKNRTHKLRC